MGKPDRNPLHYINDHEFVDEFLSGATHSEIAKKYNVTVKSVESNIRRRRVPLNINVSIDEIEDMFIKGMTLTDIAKSIGTNIWSLNRHFKFHNIDGSIWQDCRAQRISGKKLTPEIAKKLYIDEKWSSLKIANEFGFVGDSAVRDRLKKWGIRIRLDGEHAYKHSNQKMAESVRDYKSLELRYMNGESTYEIGESLGIGEGPIRRALTNAGVKLEGWAKFASKRRKGKPHEKLISILDSNSIEHISQYIIELPFRDNKIRKLEFDECLPQHRLLIEVNGSYFHGRYDRSLNNKSVRMKVWTDAFKTQAVYDNLESWYLLHIWEDEVELFNLSADFTGKIDASPFGNYKSILLAREQNLSIKVEIEKTADSVRPFYKTIIK